MRGVGSQLGLPGHERDSPRQAVLAVVQRSLISVAGFRQCGERGFVPFHVGLAFADGLPCVLNAAAPLAAPRAEIVQPIPMNVQGLPRRQGIVESAEPLLVPVRADGTEVLLEAVLVREKFLLDAGKVPAGRLIGRLLPGETPNPIGVQVGRRASKPLGLLPFVSLKFPALRQLLLTESDFRGLSLDGFPPSSHPCRTESISSRVGIERLKAARSFSLIPFFAQLLQALRQLLLGKFPLRPGGGQLPAVLLVQVDAPLEAADLADQQEQRLVNPQGRKPLVRLPLLVGNFAELVPAGTAVRSTGRPSGKRRLGGNDSIRGSDCNCLRASNSAIQWTASPCWSACSRVRRCRQRWRAEPISAISVFAVQLILSRRYHPGPSGADRSSPAVRRAA